MALAEQCNIANKEEYRKAQTMEQESPCIFIQGYSLRQTATTQFQDFVLVFPIFAKNKNGNKKNYTTNPKQVQLFLTYRYSETESLPFS